MMYRGFQGPLIRPLMPRELWNEWKLLLEIPSEYAYMMRDFGKLFLETVRTSRVNITCLNLSAPWFHGVKEVSGDPSLDLLMPRKLWNYPGICFGNFEWKFPLRMYAYIADTKFPINAVNDGNQVDANTFEPIAIFITFSAVKCQIVSNVSRPKYKIVSRRSNIGNFQKFFHHNFWLKWKLWIMMVSS